MSRTFLFLLVASAASSCLTPIDTTMKQCPCAPGFVCDSSQNRCITEACTAGVRAEDFRAEWATSNAIRFRWTPTGDRTQLVRYELRVAASLDELGTGSARVYATAENPELGGFALPRTGVTEDLVDGTTAWGLTPQRSYVAQLLVFDTSLCVFRTPTVGRATTFDLPDKVVLFEDVRASNYLPSSIRDVPDVGDGGPGRHLEWTPNLDPECIATPHTSCGNFLRLRDLSTDLEPVTGGSFTTAFVELKVANESTVPHFYAHLRLMLVDDAGGCGEVYSFVPFAMPATGSYYRVQVPLSAFKGQGRYLTADDLDPARGGTRLCEFGLHHFMSRLAADGGWARVLIDDVRVRY